MWRTTFVAPQIIEPTSLEWTQVVVEGNSYTVTYEPSVSSIEVQSSVDIHSLGFLFNAVLLDQEPEDTFELLTATIRVLADGEFYKEFDYEALPSDQTSAPIAESFTIE